MIKIFFWTRGAPAPSDPLPSSRFADMQTDSGGESDGVRVAVPTAQSPPRPYASVRVSAKRLDGGL